MSAPDAAATRRVAAHLTRGARWRLSEIAVWLAVLAAILAAPSRAGLFNEILIAGLFALSLDLILGLAGIVSLGHAAFFGLGAYTAGLVTRVGLHDPFLGLVAAAATAAAATRPSSGSCRPARVTRPAVYAPSPKKAACPSVTMPA